MTSVTRSACEEADSELIMINDDLLENVGVPCDHTHLEESKIQREIQSECSGDEEHPYGIQIYQSNAFKKLEISFGGEESGTADESISEYETEDDVSLELIQKKLHQLQLYREAAVNIHDLHFWNSAHSTEEGVHNKGAPEAKEYPDNNAEKEESCSVFNSILEERESDTVEDFEGEYVGPQEFRLGASSFLCSEASSLPAMIRLGDKEAIPNITFNDSSVARPVESLDSLEDSHEAVAMAEFANQSRMVELETVVMTQPHVIAAGSSGTLDESTMLFDANGLKSMNEGQAEVGGIETPLIFPHLDDSETRETDESLFSMNNRMQETSEDREHRELIDGTLQPWVEFEIEQETPILQAQQEEVGVLALEASSVLETPREFEDTGELVLLDQPSSAIAGDEVGPSQDEIEPPVTLSRGRELPGVQTFREERRRNERRRSSRMPRWLPCANSASMSPTASLQSSPGRNLEASSLHLPSVPPPPQLSPASTRVHPPFLPQHSNSGRRVRYNSPQEWATTPTTSGRNDGRTTARIEGRRDARRSEYLPDGTPSSTANRVVRSRRRGVVSGSSSPGGGGTPVWASPNGAATPGARTPRRGRGRRRRQWGTNGGPPQQAIDAAIEMALFGTGPGGAPPLGGARVGSSRFRGTGLVGESPRRCGEVDTGGGWSSEEEGVDEQMDPICCICITAYKRAAFIPCGHTFCRKCAKTVMRGRGRCPLCNKEIDEILKLY